LLSSQADKFVKLDARIGVSAFNARYFDIKLVELAWNPSLSLTDNVLKAENKFPKLTIAGIEQPLNEFDITAMVNGIMEKLKAEAGAKVVEIVVQEFQQRLALALLDSSSALGAFLADAVSGDCADTASDPAFRALLEGDAMSNLGSDIASLEEDPPLAHKDCEVRYSRHTAARVLLEAESTADLSHETRSALRRQGQLLHAYANQTSPFALLQLSVGACSGHSGSLLSIVDVFGRLLAAVKTDIKTALDAASSVISKQKQAIAQAKDAAAAVDTCTIARDVATAATSLQTALEGLISLFDTLRQSVRTLSISPVTIRSTVAQFASLFASALAAIETLLAKQKDNAVQCVTSLTLNMEPVRNLIASVQGATAAVTSTVGVFANLFDPKIFQVDAAEIVQRLGDLQIAAVKTSLVAVKTSVAVFFGATKPEGLKGFPALDAFLNQADAFANALIATLRYASDLFKTIRSAVTATPVQTPSDGDIERLSQENGVVEQALIVLAKALNNKPYATATLVLRALNCAPTFLRLIIKLVASAKSLGDNFSAFKGSIASAEGVALLQKVTSALKEGVAGVNKALSACGFECQKLQKALDVVVDVATGIGEFFFLPSPCCFPLLFAFVNK
jgi:hypothetical protein